MHCSLGVVFMGVWVTKIGEYTVTHVTGDEAIESFNRRLGNILVGAVDLSQILWVESLR